MERTILDKVEKDMLYLIACGLHHVQPDLKKTGQPDLELLYRKARLHSLTAMVCMVLEQTDVFRTADEAIVKKWKQAKEKAIRKSILLDAERKKILDLMEQAEIWHMPLKGSILKNLYPKYGMRQMADVDILYDASCQEKLIDVMKQQGYDVERIDVRHHDIFTKQPVYNFEMHSHLFDVKYFPHWHEYYADVKERLSQNKGTRYRYHFTDEDFYLYNITHACGHYSESGTGFRTLVDIYVYIREKGTEMDWDYIKSELEKLQNTDFEQKNRQLALKLFSNPIYLDEIPITEEEQKTLDYIWECGTYGTRKNRVEKKIKNIQSEKQSGIRTAKLRYYISRLFPGRKWYTGANPVMEKYPFLIPFHWIYRICRGLLFRRKRLFEEAVLVWKAEENTW